MKFLRGSSVLLGAIAVSCGATFLLTSKIDGTRISELEEQVEVLRKKELQARVTQRVSEQMEEIANQQTLISNKERDRAEEQKKIADMERGKAVVEKGLAVKAQQAALVSAEEAQQARKVAEKQSAIATENMKIARENQIIAEDARAHADTLRYFSLANSLAQSSLAQRGTTDISRLLAYSAWYFSEKYHSAVADLGNVYYSVLRASDSRQIHSTRLKGNLRRIHRLGRNVIGVTDYGEAVYYDGNSMESVRVGNYDFRDFLTDGKAHNTVLGVDGTIYSLDMTNIAAAKTGADLRMEEKVQLPKDFWYRLIELGDGKTLAAMGNKTVAWIDAKTFEVKATKIFDNDLKTIGIQGKTLHIFDNNQHHYVSDNPGVVASMGKLSTAGVVTAYHYDDLRNYQILGTVTGDIYIFDNDGKQIAKLLGHDAAITDLSTWGLLLGSTSNDNTLKLWNIGDLTSIISPVDVSLNSRPFSFDVNTATQQVYVGCGNTITEFCSNAARNAQATKEHLTREFTDEEWHFYVGKDIEKVKFMK